ncbi:MAG: hypothetical protein Q9187_006393 [Circinaria calcarea]
MPTLNVPPAGLALEGAPSTDNSPSKSEVKPAQVLQLNLDSGLLEALLKEARAGGRGVQLTLGKSPVCILVVGTEPIANVVTHAQALQFGNKSHKMVATTPQILRTDLYRVAEVSKDKHAERLALVGTFSHNIETRKRENVTAKADPAILQLQNSLAEAKRLRESNTTIFVKDNSKLPPAKGGKRPPAKISPPTLLKGHHRAGLFDARNAALTRSMPTSPSLGATSSSLQKANNGLTAKSTPKDDKTEKLKALKVAILHVLASRSVSQKFLASAVNCTAEECKPILEKYGREARLDPSKYDLSDRGFKELDIWKFPYKNESDREAAVERAVSAFDRQRISREEYIWQMLLPKEKRGKGIILSKLQLHNGPMQRVSTPRINVENADGAGKNETSTGSDSDKRPGRLAPRDTESTRASSQDPIKKKRVSEKEAQSKRLLSKKPKKPVVSSKPKESKPAAKKETKKDPAVSAPKVKSSEFVRDSDEEVDMEDSITLGVPHPKTKATTNSKRAESAESTKVATKAATKTAKKATATSTAPVKPKAAAATAAAPKKSTSTVSVTAEKKQTPPTSSNSASSQKSINGNQTAPAPMRRTVSHTRNTSSPIKPSPLGSSPPTNASDLEVKAQSLHPPASDRSSPVVSSQKDGSTPINKGVAHRVKKPIENTSEHSLKRKADDLDSDIHSHGGDPVPNGVDRPAKRQQTSKTESSTSEHTTIPSSTCGNSRNPSSTTEHPKNSSSASENNTIPSSASANPTIHSATSENPTTASSASEQKQIMVSSSTSDRTTVPSSTSQSTLKRKVDEIDSTAPSQGTVSITNGVNHPAKRHQISTVSSSPSDSGSSISPPLTTETIEMARKFKQYWTKYEHEHRELSALPDPPKERVEKLLRMHKTLEDMKAKICKRAAP